MRLKEKPNIRPPMGTRLESALACVALGLFGVVGLPSGASAGSGKKRTSPKKRGRVGPRRHKPKPIYTKRVLNVELGFKSGRVSTRRLRLKKHKRKVKIPRFEGRFEARLYKKGKLIESLRFDFPLLGMAETFTATGKRLWTRVTAGVKSRTAVRLPWDVEADRVVVWDRLRKRATKIPLALLKRHGMTMVKARKAGERNPRKTRPRKGSGGKDKEESGE